MLEALPPPPDLLPARDPSIPPLPRVGGRTVSGTKVNKSLDTSVWDNGESKLRKLQPDEVPRGVQPVCQPESDLH